MSANVLKGEAAARVHDHDYLLVLDNEGWVAVEDVLDQSYVETVAYLLHCEVRKLQPKLKVVRAVLYGATRMHHGEMSLGECGQLLLDHGEAIADALGAAVRGSIRFKDPVPGEAKPAKRPATTNGTGRKPSAAITKRAVKPKRSGAKRR